MKISAVIPCFNHGHLLEAKIRELEGQTLRPEEIVIVDDCSTDDSFDVAKGLRSEIPITVLRNDTNLKVPETENRGVSVAKSPHVFLTACDDALVCPSAFSRAAAAFSRTPTAAFWCTPSQFLNLDLGVGWVSGRMFERALFVDPALAVKMLQAGVYSAQGQTMVWRKDAFTPYVAEHRWHCDCLPPLRAAIRHGFSYDPEPSVLFTTQTGTYSSNGRKTPEHAESIQAVVQSILQVPELVQALAGSAYLSQFGAAVLPAVRGTPLASWALARAALVFELRRRLAYTLPKGLVQFLHRKVMGV